MQNMESESGTSTTKISDSAYSKSCSNSNSQRSASSKSRHSGSNSSGSSGYCGTNNQDKRNDIGFQAPKRNKEHKKKKLKSASNLNAGNISTLTLTPAESICAASKQDTSSVETMGVDILPVSVVETATPVLDSIQKNDTISISPTTTKADTADTSPPNKEMLWSEKLPNMEIDDKSGINLDSAMKMEVPLENKKASSCQPEGGFCCIISMYDGVVLYTTPSLTAALGFPKDMWLGRSFIDFVHPKDRETFSSQITTGIALPFADSQDKSKDVTNCVHVCLRKHRTKASALSIVDKAVSYQAFRLNVTFRQLTETPETRKYSDSNNGMFLVVVANPVLSSYKVPEEKVSFGKFGMKHNAACIFSHVDPDVVNSFGFLPQDMLGKSIFDFYHPEDMPFMKEIYESVTTMCQIAGSVFRSKPYRFAVQNGGFVMIETEWSSFVNPWSRRLEFVIGLHRVLQGPKNPDIFDTNKDDETRHISDEAIRESKQIQEEIILLLNKELSRPSDAVRYEVSRRYKDLANFMEYLMDEVNRSALHLEIPADADPTISVSLRGKDRDSVMLGEISPHHDYCDSKSSSETPPSYNQLNYHENIQRFFQSKPKTTVDESEKPSASNDQDRVISSVQHCPNNQKCLSPVENSGASGSGSAGNLSSESNPNMESGTTSATNTSNDSYRPLLLTEAVLNKHNEDMEKIMIKRHKQQRSVTKERDSKKGNHKSNNHENHERMPHGIKRSVSHSWEGDNRKVCKHNKHQLTRANIENIRPSGDNVKSRVVNSTKNNNPSRPNDVNVWPPFSVSVTPMNNTQSINVTSPSNPLSGFAAGMFPLYFIPTQRDPLAQPGYHFQYMPGMIYNYNSVFSAPPIICSPMPVVPVPVPPVPPSNLEVVRNSANMELKPSPQSIASTLPFQRPVSQATSVKAEPGSIASASVANKALSECSRKDLTLQSVCSPGSPLVSPPDGEMEHFQVPSKFQQQPQKYRSLCRLSVLDTDYTVNEIKEDARIFRTNNTVDDESCFSSSYSSFLKTDYGSGSNDDGNNAENKSLSTDDDNNCKNRPIFPMKKREPPWLETVSITPDVVYRYQMSQREMKETLEADLNVLRKIDQPMLVNDQLNQLYIEMELEGLSTKLTLEEGITTSGSSSGDETSTHSSKHKKKRKSHSSIMMMIYEEDASLPSPTY